MERVDVSVIVPIYNGEKYIKKIINAAMPYRKESIEGEQLSSDNEYVKDRIVIWLLKNIGMDCRLFLAKCMARLYR